MKTFRIILVIIAATFFLGTANFFVNPKFPKMSLAKDEVDLQTVKNLPSNLLIVDARSAKDFAIARVENAINLSEDNFDSKLGEFLDAWNPDCSVVVYCSSSSCNSSRNVARRLTSECGLKNVYVFKGDWQKWKN